LNLALGHLGAVLGLHLTWIEDVIAKHLQQWHNEGLLGGFLTPNESDPRLDLIGETSHVIFERHLTLLYQQPRTDPRMGKQHRSGAASPSRGKSRP